MSKYIQEQQDHMILSAISGDESAGHGGFQIHDNYLKREREENMRECGLGDFDIRHSIPDDLWKFDYYMSELENTRVDLRNPSSSLIELESKQEQRRANMTNKTKSNMQLINSKLNQEITLKKGDFELGLTKSISWNVDKTVKDCFLRITLSDNKTLVIGSKANIWMGIATEEQVPTTIEL